MTGQYQHLGPFSDLVNVQYLLDDALFPVDGMQAADQLLRERYEEAGAPEAYIGEFYSGGHRFDAEMQESAFTRLAEWLT